MSPAAASVEILGILDGMNKSSGNEIEKLLDRETIHPPETGFMNEPGHLGLSAPLIEGAACSARAAQTVYRVAHERQG